MSNGANAAARSTSAMPRASSRARSIGHSCSNHRGKSRASEVGATPHALCCGAIVSESDRRHHLAELGYNPLRLPSARVPFDLFSDVAPEVLVPPAARDASDVDPDSVCEVFLPLTGEARLALATKGRAAEIALVDALELAGPPVVLTHGLFSTTQAALARRGAVLEELRLAQPEGSADVDLDHLADRLGKGGVQLVYLEVANNALYGW